mgnify:CR=1 FL=1
MDYASTNPAKNPCTTAPNGREITPFPLPQHFGTKRPCVQVTSLRLLCIKVRARSRRCSSFSAKSHACFGCSVASALTTPPLRYQLFAVRRPLVGVSLPQRNIDFNRPLHVSKEVDCCKAVDFFRFVWYYFSLEVYDEQLLLRN